MERVFLLLGIPLCTFALALLGASPLSAAAPGGNFSLQVSPSPLVSTVKPGVPTEIELKIRNASTATESLQIQPRSFTFDNASGKVQIDETKQPEIAPWVSFSAPKFQVKPNETYTQKIRIALPKDTGFSYPFALQITRTSSVANTDGVQVLNGSVAIFTLVNVDRPGATKKVELASFKPEKSLYEYLPATFDVRLKNTGNTIVQPYGNVYIQNGDSDKGTLKTLPVNDARAYLLPGTTRSLKATWADGFPVYVSTTDATGTTKSSLKWNFDKLSQLRIGRYTAKVVAVYNDGTRDVPITGEVSFWVIPWKAILGLVLALAVVVLVFRRYLKHKTDKAVKKALNKQRDS